MEQNRKPAAGDGGAEQLVGSVAKYSISTVLNFVISGIALVLGSFVIPDQALYGEVVQFTAFTNTIMTIVIFGLDQGFIRFYSEPPGKTGSAGIFRLCFYLSTSVLAASGVVCSLFFAGPLRALFAFNQLGPEIIPLLFLNAFFWMVARYFYTLYRMEQNILHYTLVSLLMNFCYRLAYLLGALFTQNGFLIVLCSLLALVLLALYLLVSRRKILRPRRADWDKPTLKALVPYSAAVAPTAVMVVLNSSFSLVFVATYINEAARGTYGYGVQVSNLVTAIQGGFASFWGAYMFANYKTRQPLIKKV
ncbi:MAG: lipopolysaccharide biosynthesis protein, partial [Oscillospiraceae bacterium]